MRVALINMPFGSSTNPNSGLSIIKAVLRDRDIECKILYPSLELSHIIDSRAYQHIEYGNLPELEYVASRIAFKQPYCDQDIRDFAQAKGFDWLFLLSLRQHTESLIKRWGNKDWSKYQVIGFTTKEGQLTCSFALAQLIKKRFPNTIIAFGGPSMLDAETGQELIDKLDYIDVIFSGPSEFSFAEMVDSLRLGKTFVEACENAGTIGDLTYRRDDKTVQKWGAIPPPIQQVPLADISDWTEMGLPYAFPVQFSRGCCYGSTRPCAFCTEPYINKGCLSVLKPEMALEKLEHITGHYKSHNIMILDVLMPPNYADKVFAEFKRRHPDRNLTFFAELLASTPKQKLKSLVDAGLYGFQAGIEALDDDALRLLRKPHKTYDSINILRYAQKYKVSVIYNYLINIPGDDLKSIERQRQVIKNCLHLQGPHSTVSVHVTRCSYYYDNLDEFSIELKGPAQSYHFWIPDHLDGNKICWSFDYNRRLSIEVTKIIDLISPWRKFSKSVVLHKKTMDESPWSLYYIKNGVYDTRRDTEEIHKLSNIEMRLMRECDDPKSCDQLLQITPDAEKITAELIERNLMYGRDGMYIAYPSIP